MFSHFIFALFALLSLLSFVAAHGYVSKVVIDGTTYTGNAPAAKPSDSPIRQTWSFTGGVLLGQTCIVRLLPKPVSFA